MFSVIIAPMLFFGCAYYPWRGLDVLPVMKYAVLINPMVYVAEGMRGALTPSTPHMPLGLVILAHVRVASQGVTRFTPSKPLRQSFRTDTR